MESVAVVNSSTILPKVFGPQLPSHYHPRNHNRSALSRSLTCHRNTLSLVGSAQHQEALNA